MKNLIILIFLWVATSIDYFLMNFLLKYYEGDIFVNTMVRLIKLIQTDNPSK